MTLPNPSGASTLLRRAADAIEAGAEYDWYNSNKCTLGNLHLALTGDAARSRERIGISSGWGCGIVAGQESPEMVESKGCVQDLMAAGLSFADILDLECLTAPAQSIPSMEFTLGLDSPDLQWRVRARAVRVLREKATKYELAGS